MNSVCIELRFKQNLLLCEFSEAGKPKTAKYWSEFSDFAEPQRPKYLMFYITLVVS